MLKRKYGLKTSLALVESRLQLFSLITYLKERPEKVILVVRLNENEYNDTALMKLLESNKKLFYKIITYKAKRNSKISLIISFLTRVLVKIFYITFDHIYIGDPNSIWMNKCRFFLCYNHITLLEDGMASVAFYFKCHDGFLKNKKPIRLITTFNLVSTDNIIIYKLDVEKINKKIKNNEYWIIGMPMVENKALNSEQYIHYLTLVQQHCSNAEKMYYIPHRYESDDNLSYYHSLGFKVMRLDNSVEEYLAKSDYFPEKIISLYSTALENARQKFTDVKIYSYILNENIIAEPYKVAAINTYKYYKSTGEIAMVIIDD